MSGPIEPPLGGYPWFAGIDDAPPDDGTAVDIAGAANTGGEATAGAPDEALGVTFTVAAWPVAAAGTNAAARAFDDDAAPTEGEGRLSFETAPALRFVLEPAPPPRGPCPIPPPPAEARRVGVNGVGAAVLCGLVPPSANVSQSDEVTIGSTDFEGGTAAAVPEDSTAFTLPGRRSRGKLAHRPAAFVVPTDAALALVTSSRSPVAAAATAPEIPMPESMIPSDSVIMFRASIASIEAN